MSLLQENPKGTGRIGVETPFFLLSLAAVALRLWARNLTRMDLKFNDFAILVATVRKQSDRGRAAKLDC